MTPPTPPASEAAKAAADKYINTHPERHDYYFSERQVGEGFEDGFLAGAQAARAQDDERVKALVEAAREAILFIGDPEKRNSQGEALAVVGRIQAALGAFEQGGRDGK